MQIRLATLRDLNDLNELMRLSKAYWGYDHEFMNQFMLKFEITAFYLSKSETYLINENDKIIGFYSFSTNDNGDLELDNLFLHPDVIGVGKGKELWQLCIKTARQQGAKTFVLWSDPHAEGFYFKMGCQKIGERLSPLMPNRYPPIFKYTIP